jgi:feruloyl-CoA synthase
MRTTPRRPADTFAQPDVAMERRADGTLLLRSTAPLPSHEATLGEAFMRSVSATPDAVLATQQRGTARAGLTYAEASARARALAQTLLALGLGAERPVMVLSGNSLEHLVLALAGAVAGIPVLPVSVAYSLQTADHARIRAIAELTAPGLVFADDAERFGPALDALRRLVPTAMVARGARPDALAFEAACEAEPTAIVDTAFAAVSPDHVAKLLFTSGSTGDPKGVITTHRMLCSNQAMLRASWPFIEHEPPVLVDWLPWSHTFGGNHNLNLVLFNGGTLHIDEGRPAPGLIGETISALRENPPTVYFNVPAGYALLVPALEADPAFARTFFSRLRFMFYAAAALPDALASRLRAIAAATSENPVPLTSAWGATETAPAVTSAHFPDPPLGCIGVPLAGTTVKLAPEGDKLEIRVKGPNVTPGYHGRPDLTAAAFDSEGFYRTGDAVTPVDADDPSCGLLFDGRIAEDFKLTTGTWVGVGRLRTGLLGAARVLSDAVICGHDRDSVCALAWVNPVEARSVCGSADDVTLDDPRLREHLRQALLRLNAGAGSAGQIQRLLLLDDPPDFDAGEITDKGYLNQRACLRLRARDVERLYAPGIDSDVIIANPC